MSKLYNDASLLMIPSSVKDGKLYSIFPQPKVISGELVTNGTFDEDASWNKGTGWDITGGKAVFSGIDFASLLPESSFLTIGKTYKLSLTAVITNGSFKVQHPSSGDLIEESESGSYIVTFVATSNTFSIARASVGQQNDFSIDNVSVVEVDQLPADFDFSRGSNLAATRINEQGLIEKGRENLLLQSNQFDEDTNWTTTNINVTSGQSGYDGSSDAWKIEGTGSSVFSYIVQTDTTSIVKTKSVYAKAGSVDWVAIWSGSSNYAYFDLQNGVVGWLSGAYAIDSSITSVGGGWYRCEVAMTQDATQFYIVPANADGNTNLSTGEYVYIQDAQLEAGLVATDYIESGANTGKAGVLEDLPRLDWSGSCPSLLLEPQRSNEFPNSEYLSGYQLGRTKLTHNSATSPEGVDNAVKLYADNQTGTHYIRIDKTSTSDAVFSVFAKKGEETSFAIGNATSSNAVVFNLENGTITSEVGGTGTIEPVGNGWYRCSYHRTVWADWQYIRLRDNQTSYTGDNLSGIYLYGLQFEEGSYATSYIPTHGTSVTRSADANNASFADIENEGTMFGEVEVVNTGAYGTPMALSIDNATANFVLVYKTNTNKLSARIRFGGVDQCVIETGTLTEGYHKFAFRYRENDCAFFVDGVSIGTDTSVSIPTGLNVIRQYIGSSTNFFVGGTKQITYFPTALSDNECINLTSI